MHTRRRNLVKKREDEEEVDEDIEDEEDESRDARQIDKRRGKSRISLRNKAKKKDKASRYPTSNNQVINHQI